MQKSPVAIDFARILGLPLIPARTAAITFSRLVLIERRDKGSPDEGKDHETRSVLDREVDA